MGMVVAAVVAVIVWIVLWALGFGRTGDAFIIAVPLITIGVAMAISALKGFDENKS